MKKTIEWLEQFKPGQLLQWDCPEKVALFSDKENIDWVTEHLRGGKNYFLEGKDIFMLLNWEVLPGDPGLSPAVRVHILKGEKALYFVMTDEPDHSRQVTNRFFTHIPLQAAKDLFVIFNKQIGVPKNV